MPFMAGRRLSKMNSRRRREAGQHQPGVAQEERHPRPRCARRARTAARGAPTPSVAWSTTPSISRGLAPTPRPMPTRGPSRPAAGTSWCRSYRDPRSGHAATPVQHEMSSPGGLVSSTFWPQDPDRWAERHRADPRLGRQLQRGPMAPGSTIRRPGAREPDQRQSQLDTPGPTSFTHYGQDGPRCFQVESSGNMRTLQAQ